MSNNALRRATVSSAEFASANGVKFANVDEHHGDLAAFTREDVVTLLQQTRREGWVDVTSEGPP